MASMAGQPEYVGVMVTWTAGPVPPSSTIRTSRRMPRSSMVSTGISGIAHRGGDVPGLLLGGDLVLVPVRHVHVHGGHQLAPGCSRASTCISARM